MHDQDQPIWDLIGAANPAFFLSIGDNVYADLCVTRADFKNRYDQLAQKPEYARFRTKVPIFATWDDHDFGINDGGVTFAHKQVSKEVMLDFYGEPLGTARRARDGIYTSYMFGPQGKRLQVILLDLRWFRTPSVWDDIAESYLPTTDPDATMLGDAQWAWLEDELKKPADLRVIASSTQFVSPDHIWEKWSNIPHEKQRLMDLLDRLAVKNAFIVSGDMHYGELSMQKTPNGFSLYDLTSSGLNIVEPGVDNPNQHRIAIHDTTSNFGVVEIDWGTSSHDVTLQVRDNSGLTVISQQITL